MNGVADPSRACLQAGPLRIGRVSAEVFTLPTDRPESDGTLEWRATTLVIADVTGAGQIGTGYTYGGASAATCIRETLAGALEGRAFASPQGAWWAMVERVRNLGFCGIAAMAVSALDAAVWDLWGKVLGVSSSLLLGATRDAVPVYGSGGFTSYSVPTLRRQLAGWVESGIPRVKMKVGRQPGEDPARVRAAREAIGDDAELFVDANGAYSVKQALALAERFSDEADVRWLEEPRPAVDAQGNRRVRRAVPARVEIAGGEYVYTTADARRLLRAGAVDVLQADVTRCGGFTGFAAVAGAAETHGVPLSVHCAPALGARAAIAAPGVRHVEYFHDHARIERRFIEGAADPVAGELHPDLSRPGLGLVFRRGDLRRAVRRGEGAACA